jgi:GTPase SAR1 family protein
LFIDTAGQEIHNSIPHSYFKEADHFILVFDPTDNRSEIEKQLRYWLNSVTNNNKNADKITIIAHNKGNKNAHDFENANTTKEIVEQEITKFNKDYEQTLQHKFFRIDGLKNDDETSLQTLNVKNIKLMKYFLFL